ncbi:MAG: sensor histidine kinase [Paenibacillaceae bacterium]
MMQWMNSSLRAKLSIIMLISTMVPLLSFGAFTYVISSNVTEAKMKQAGINTLGQMESKLEFVLNDIESMSIFLIGQNDIQQYLKSPQDDKQTRTRILNSMANLASSKPYISNILLYPNSQEIPLSTATIYESDLLEQIDVFQVKEKTWTGLYNMVDYAGEHKVLTFIRPMRSIYTFKNIGWLLISLDEDVLAQYWSLPKLGEGRGQVALLNETGIVLSSTEKEWLSQPFDTYYPSVRPKLGRGVYGETLSGEGEEKRNILYYRSQSIGWTLVGTIPYELNRAQNLFILQLTGVAVGITILINAGLVLFVVQRVTNPLRILARLLTKINPDEPMPMYQPSSTDEIGRLGQSYNMLGKHIQELKEQLIRNETRKKEADIRALEAQINPHFLYNTLSSIHWMALTIEEKRIAEMVGALSDFLQFSLNKGNEFCPLHQELSHIENYMQIQSIRFPDKFEIDYFIDAELQDKYMLKLLLQPLLENSMIHGIQKKEGKGTIAVYVEKLDNRMYIQVLDDGIGMTEERLLTVRNSLEEPDDHDVPNENYGLRNVNERLRLHYGSDAILHIDSKRNTGTRIAFSIPIMEGPHENHDRG